MKQLLSSIMFLSGFSLLIIMISSDGKFSSTEESSLNNEPIGLALLIRQDLNNLQVNNQLPKEWSQIASPLITSKSYRGQTPIKAEEFGINTTKLGKYRLEITIFPEDESYEKGRIFARYEIFQIENENKIWETIRLYDLQKKTAH